MNIITKFQPGDTVVRLHDNKVQTATIGNIHIHVRSRGYADGRGDGPIVEVKYSLSGDGIENDSRVSSEKEIFATKAELLASL